MEKDALISVLEQHFQATGHQLGTLRTQFLSGFRNLIHKLNTLDTLSIIRHSFAKVGVQGNSVNLRTILENFGQEIEVDGRSVVTHLENHLKNLDAFETFKSSGRITDELISRIPNIETTTTGVPRSDRAITGQRCVMLSNETIFQSMKATQLRKKQNIKRKRKDPAVSTIALSADMSTSQ